MTGVHFKASHGVSFYESWVWCSKPFLKHPNVCKQCLQTLLNSLQIPVINWMKLNERNAMCQHDELLLKDFSPWEILFRRSPAGCEWASPEVANQIYLSIMRCFYKIYLYIIVLRLFTNQVWTFRLAKLEGVDGVDQVALHKSPVDHTHLVVIVSIECKSS